MNWVDYAILAVLGLSVLIGLMRGLISEVLAMVVWAAAFWVAWVYGPAVAAQFNGMIPLPSERMVAGYAACFIAVLVLGALLRFIVARMIVGVGLSGTDRLLGMLFGFARGVLIVCFLVFLVGFTGLTRQSWWQQSILLPQFQQVASWLEQRVPPGVRDLHPPAQLSHLPHLDDLPHLKDLPHLNDLPRLPGSMLNPISGRTPAQAGSAPPPHAAVAAPAPSSSAAARIF